MKLRKEERDVTQAFLRAQGNLAMAGDITAIYRIDQAGAKQEVFRVDIILQHAA